MNPNENIWHELKEFIRREAKPQNKQQLIDGIQPFWRTMTKEKCCRHVNHIHKVIAKVIENSGNATGYWLNFLELNVIYYIIMLQRLYYLY